MTMTKTEETKCRERLAAAVGADNPALAATIRNTRDCWGGIIADPELAHWAIFRCHDLLTDEQIDRLVNAAAGSAEWARRTLLRCRDVLMGVHVDRLADAVAGSPHLMETMMTAAQAKETAANTNDPALASRMLECAEAAQVVARYDEFAATATTEADRDFFHNAMKAYAARAEALAAKI